MWEFSSACPHLVVSARQRDAWRARSEVDEGRKAKSEIGAGNLCTISSPKFWMGVDRVVIQRCGATGMHARIDQSRNRNRPLPSFPRACGPGTRFVPISTILPSRRTTSALRSGTARSDEIRVTFWITMP
jgi:hypothetical protein